MRSGVAFYESHGFGRLRVMMAIVFELWAECSTEVERGTLVDHFDGFQCTLLSGRTISWRAFPTPGLPTALTVHSDGLSNSGIKNLQHVLETTESGLRLYHHLKIGPAFRFARIALEAGCVPLMDLKDYVAPIAPGEYRFEVECVVDDALYKELGSPQFCFPFRPGYWWTRYSGERYSPLHSNDQPGLNELCRSLFAEYVKYWSP